MWFKDNSDGSYTRGCVDADAVLYCDYAELEVIQVMSDIQGGCVRQSVTEPFLLFSVTRMRGGGRKVPKSVTYYKWTSLYALDRDRKNCLAYNEFSYKKIKNDFKLEDLFQKYGQFAITDTRIQR